MIDLIPADEATFAWLAEREPRDDMPSLCPGGVAPPEVLAIVAGMAADVRGGFAGESAWLIVAAGEVVGLVSYKAPPHDGVTEIGYGIAESRQRRGYATAAVRALIDHARANDLQALTAQTQVDNRASQHVLERAGFVVTGEGEDPEDGPVFCWSIALAEGSMA